MSQTHMSQAMTAVMLIAGGTGSIGKEVAAQALSAGWAVVIQGGSDATVDAALQSLQTQFPDAALKGLAVDIRQSGAIEQLVDLAGQFYGQIDAVVDCLVTGPSSGGIVGPFSTTNPDAYLELMNLSVVYLQKLAFTALPWLQKSEGCLIAFVSDAAIFAAPRQTLIGAARAATVGFIRNFAMEVARDGVRAHCVSPSFVLDTASATRLEKSAKGRLEKAQQKAGLGLPTPRDIAPVVLFLCGGGAKKITGQIISINGGLHA